MPRARVETLATSSTEGNCNVDDALCNTPAPVCPEGYLPSVIDHCWGPCVLERRRVS
ncbi:MAG: hypothetical protein JW751_28060 [Polyangiaceae bacterium]|nr:hypothetical protein [Polyangiaceae bacterium]